MNTHEAGKVIGISPDTVRSLVDQGYIEAEKIGRFWELLDSDVQAMAARYRKRPNWRRSEHRVDPQRSRIIDLYCRGNRPVEIAAIMGRTVKSIRKHIERLQKAGLCPRTVHRRPATPPERPSLRGIPLAPKLTA